MFADDLLLKEQPEEKDGNAQYIIGRMGVPYQKRKISVISIIMDAPQPVISALSGKLGKLEGVSTKALYSNVMENVDG